MKAKLLIAVLSIVTMSNAIAYHVKGVPNCGEWIKDQQSKSTVDSFYNRAWLLGFLSGLNADDRNGNFLKKVSYSQIYLWMDNYCKAHPLDDLADGGDRLTIELMNKK